MRRHRIITLAINVLILLTVTTGVVYAASDTLTIQGAVAAILSITATSQPGYNTLNLASNVTDQLVAVVNEKCNRNAGYTVDIQSANGVAHSLNAAGFYSGTTSDSLSYTVKYDGNAVSFTNGAATSVINSNSKSPQAGTNRNVTISYSAASANLAEGTYSDTLTFTITAK